MQFLPHPDFGSGRQLANRDRRITVAVIEDVASFAEGIAGMLNERPYPRPADSPLRARVSVDGSMFDRRVSTVPTRDDEKAVISVPRPDAAKTLSTAASECELRLLRGEQFGLIVTDLHMPEQDHAGGHLRIPKK
jgi:CheY-like chemotaxis protein